MKNESRRSFLAKTVEWLAITPLAALIVNNFNSRTTYYSIDASQAQQVENLGSDVERFRALNQRVSESLGRLAQVYRDAYHKRHTRIVRVGKTTTTQVYYTWEEPSNVPKHGVIDGWKDYQESVTAKANGLVNNSKVDLTKLENLVIEQVKTDRGSEGLASVGLYVPQIAALLMYEEAIAKIKHGNGYGNYGLSPSQLVEKHDTRQQITRRSFFKAGAAVAGALLASPIVAHNREERLKGKELLEQEIKSAISTARMTNNGVFNLYFEKSPGEVIQKIDEAAHVSRATLNSDVRHEGVKRAFEDVVDVGFRTVADFKNSIGNGVLEDIGRAAKSALITENLAAKSSSEHTAVYAGLAISAVAVAAGIAGVLTPVEIVSEWYANNHEKQDGQSMRFR